VNKTYILLLYVIVQLKLALWHFLCPFWSLMIQKKIVWVWN